MLLTPLDILSKIYFQFKTKRPHGLYLDLSLVLDIALFFAICVWLRGYYQLNKRDTNNIFQTDDMMGPQLFMFQVLRLIICQDKDMLEIV